MDEAVKGVEKMQSKWKKEDLQTDEEFADFLREASKKIDFEGLCEKLESL